MDAVKQFKTLANQWVGDKLEGESTVQYIRRIYKYAYAKVGFVSFFDLLNAAIKDVLAKDEDYADYTVKEKKATWITNMSKIEDEMLIIKALVTLKDDLS